MPKRSDALVVDEPISRAVALAIRAGVSPKVISERLGHHTPEFTMHQYAHVLPGMQADAARIFEQLVAPSASEKSEKTREKRQKNAASPR